VKADLEGKAHFDECPLIIDAIRELKISLETGNYKLET
jgi:hypothetical protein